MDLKQARRFYKTYKRHPNNTLDIKTFLTICETYEYYLKEVRNLVSDRDREIEKLRKENKELKERVEHMIDNYNEILQNNVALRNKIIELREENNKLKKDVEFYKEIAMKGGQ